MNHVEVRAVADHGVLVSFAKEVSDEAHAKVLALDTALAASPPPGMAESVPALVNLLVTFDCMITDHKAIEAHIRALLPSLQVRARKAEVHTVKVCYEAPFAPDLQAVASATGLSEDAVINAHLAGDYQVLMYGFAPGYAYLAGVPAPIQLPRKPTPVRDVPAGSVIIAGPQCLVTTLTMPTGWSILGRSPTPILTGDADKPFLFDVGDAISFERIDLATFEELSKGRANG